MPANASGESKSGVIAGWGCVVDKVNEIYGWGQRPFVAAGIDVPDGEACTELRRSGRLRIHMVAIENGMVPLPVDRPLPEYLIQVLAAAGVDWETARLLVTIGENVRLLRSDVSDLVGELAILVEQASISEKEAQAKKRLVEWRGLLAEIGCGLERLAAVRSAEGVPGVLEDEEE